jgi:hypothetical protein
MDTANSKGRGVEGVPLLFRAACLEATRGESGYYEAGWALLHNLPTLVKGESEDDRQAKLDELEGILGDRGDQGDQGDDRSVIAWFKRELPRCMELVPARRRRQFVKGVFDSWMNELFIGLEPISEDELRSLVERRLAGVLHDARRAVASLTSRKGLQGGELARVFTLRLLDLGGLASRLVAAWRLGLRDSLSSQHGRQNVPDEGGVADAGVGRSDDSRKRP